MNITEQSAYIKGLCDGLKLDPEKPETKVINAIVEFLDSLTVQLSDMEELYDEMSEQVDAIDCDLADVEDEVFGEDEDFDFGADNCDDGFGIEDEENPFYEVICSSCGKQINVSEDVLLEGEIECPNCGELLEFDFSELLEDENDDVSACEVCDYDADFCAGCPEADEAE